MANHLTKITTRAKQLKKTHPNTKWTNLVKKAAAELRSGKAKAKPKAVHGVKKVHHKKHKTMAKTTGRTVVVAGHKKRKTQHHGIGKIKTAMSFWETAKILGGSIVGGGVGAILQRKVPGKQITKSVVTLAVGGAGMMYLGGKHPFMFGIANGIGTAGGVNTLHATGVISGVEDMVSGLFDGMNGPGELQGVYEDQQKIPTNTAGNSMEDKGIHQGGYMGINAGDIDKWVMEGVPPVGADFEQWR